MTFAIQGSFNILGPGVFSTAPIVVGMFTQASTSFTASPIVSFNTAGYNGANSVFAWTPTQVSFSTNGLTWSQPTNLPANTVITTADVSTGNGIGNAVAGANSASLVVFPVPNTVTTSTVVAPVAVSLPVTGSQSNRPTVTGVTNITSPSTGNPVWIAAGGGAGTTGNATIWTTTDPAASSGWTEYVLPTNNAVVASDYGNGLYTVATADGNIWTSPSGNTGTWTSTNIANIPAGTINDISFDDTSNTFVITGANNRIYQTKTPNVANTWTQQSVPNTLPAGANIVSVTSTKECTVATAVADAGLSTARSWLLKGIFGPIGASIVNWVVDYVTNDSLTVGTCYNAKTVFGNIVGNVFTQTSYASIGRFVAVASGTATGAYTGTGLTWNPGQTLGFTNYPGSMTYGAGKFLTVGYSDTRVLSSTDGTTWTNTANLATTNQRYVVYGPTGSQNYFVSFNNGTTGFYSQDGGVTWTATTTPGTVYGLASGSDKIVAGGSAVIYYSNISLIFSSSNSVGFTGAWQYGGGDGSNQFMIGVNNSNSISYSNDAGNTWTYTAAPPGATGTGPISYGSLTGVGTVWMRTGGTRQSAYSTDNGSNWTNLVMPLAVRYLNLAVGPDKFISTDSTSPANQFGGISYTGTGLRYNDGPLFGNSSTWNRLNYLNSQLIVTDTTNIVLYSSSGNSNTWSSARTPMSGTRYTTYDSTNGYIIVGGITTGITQASITSDFTSYSNSNAAMTTPRGTAYGSGKTVICGQYNNYAAVSYSTDTALTPIRAANSATSSVSWRSFDQGGTQLVLTNSTTRNGTAVYSDDYGNTWTGVGSVISQPMAWTGSAWIYRNGNTVFTTSTLANSFTSAVTGNIDGVTNSGTLASHAVSLGTGALFFTNNGVLYTTTGGANTWSRANGAGFTSGISRYLNGRVYLSGYAQYSSDSGATWSSISYAGTYINWTDMAYGNGVYVAVYNNNNYVYRSTDGVNFEQVTIGFNTGYGISYFTSQNIFITDNLVSSDGNTWAAVGIASNGGQTFFSGVTLYTSTGKLLQIVNNANQTVEVVASAGISWRTIATRPLRQSYYWAGIVYGGGKFVVTPSINGAFNKASTSTDGITWTEIDLPVVSASSITWDMIRYVNGNYVIFSATTVYFLYSSDGTNWSSGTWPFIGTGGGDRDIAYYNGYYIICSANQPLFFAQNLTDSTNLWRAVGWLAPGVNFQPGQLAVANSLLINIGNNGGNTLGFIRFNWGVTWLGIPSPINFPNGIVYGGGVYVIVGNNTSLAITSSDGITWTTRTLPVSQQWTYVAYGNGLFVAMSSAATTAYAISSDNGATWTSVTFSVSRTIRSLGYSQGYWIAGTTTSGTILITTTPTVGSSWSIAFISSRIVNLIVNGSRTMLVGWSTLINNVLLGSPGVGWLSATGAGTNTWFGIAYGNGTYVALTSNGGQVATSTDGITWTQQATGVSVSVGIVKIVYGGGRFIAIQSITSTTNQYLTSTNGTTWTVGTFPTSTRYSDIAYNGTLWMVIAGSTYLGGTTTNVSYSSADGLSWSLVTQSASAQWAALASNGNLFAAMTYGQSLTEYTRNGITWSSSTLPSAISWNGLAIGAGRYVAVAFNSSIAAVSTDGNVWTRGTMSSTSNWRAVAYGNGLFVAIAQNSNLSSTSPDGDTWTQGGTLPGSNLQWVAITYASGYFVAVATNSGTTAYSANGGSWQSATATSRAYLGLITNGTSVIAFAASTQSFDRGTFANGVLSWQSLNTLPSASGWTAGAYGGGIFMLIGGTAVAYSGSTGDSWSQTSTLPNQSWTSLTYGTFAGQGTFVAVAQSTNASAVSYDNGQTWSQPTLPASATWNSVSFG